MAHISRLGLAWHLRAEPNQYILHYRKGRLVRSGSGLAYWFTPLSAATAQTPVEDVETTFLLTERSADVQEVNVQCTLAYRCTDPKKLAARVNFGIGLDSGAWAEQPLERLANLWAQRAQQSARAYLMEVPVVEALRSGAEVIRRRIEESLKQDPEIEAMGLAVVYVQVTQIAPSSELEKALQTPSREAIQQKADEAVFQRRALAVEKERAIKENELATDIELARRQEQLIQRQGANRLLGVQTEAAAAQAKAEADSAESRIVAESHARDVRLRAAGDAEAQRLLAEARINSEKERLAVWRDAPTAVALGLALQKFAGKINTIQHLNVTPDLLGAALQQFLREQADR